MPNSPPTPAERFAAILLALGRAVAAMAGGERLSLPLIALIIDRIRGINQRVARLVARIGAGTYVPRRYPAARRPPAVRPTRRKSPLPHSAGWLLKLVPDAVGYRSQLEHLFRDDEMAALLATAPAPLRRPLRSLCWMLGVTPPPVLAAPARLRPPRTPPAAAPEPAPPRSPGTQPPAPAPRRRRWSLARICGPPHPA